MKEEYLWDKSGEPDPEIEQLEQLLGTLRYQPKSLELPNDIQSVRRNRYLPLLAIAATVLVALLAGILWLTLQSKHADQPRQANVPHTPVPNTPGPVVPGIEEEKLVRAPTPNRHRQVALNTPRRAGSPAAPPSKEALLVKEQLMTALRLASEKLNLAQRKAQGPTPNQIRNQHKVG